MRSRNRLAAGVLAGTMLLAACGGGGSDDAGSGAQSGEALPAVDAESDTTESGEDAPAAAPAAQGEAFVDLVGTELIPAADIPTNLLPDVVIDDLTNDRKVNFRNLVPQEKPILLWMYAPH